MRRHTLALIGLLLVGLAAPPATSAAPTIVFTGRGWGHGVGMSQWGAEGLARHGRSYEQILAHYYPGTRLGRRRDTIVRVLLGAGRRALRVGSLRGFVVVDAAGRRLVLPRGAVRLGPALRVRGRALRGPLRFEPGARPLRLDRRPYRGALVVRSRGGRLSVVNEVGLERYLRGVVPWEMPDRFHPEALEAQAVAARSYALTGIRRGRLYDLLADARDQVYGGLRAEERATDAAVAATTGRVLTWGGRVARAYYHSTSGGRTAAAADVFGFELPYLRSVLDPFDSGSPHHVRNRVVVTPRMLAARLKSPPLATAVDVVCETNASGRPVALLVRTPSGAWRLPAGRVQEALGVQGSWFEVSVLELRRPARRPVAGRALVLTGVARGMGNVELEELLRSGWRRVGAVRVRGDGTFARRLRASGNGTYRLRAGRVTSAPVFVPIAPAR